MLIWWTPLYIIIFTSKLFTFCRRNISSLRRKTSQRDFKNTHEWAKTVFRLHLRRRNLNSYVIDALTLFKSVQLTVKTMIAVSAVKKSIRRTEIAEHIKNVGLSESAQRLTAQHHVTTFDYKGEIWHVMATIPHGIHTPLGHMGSNDQPKLVQSILEASIYQRVETKKGGLIPDNFLQKYKGRSEDNPNASRIEAIIKKVYGKEILDRSIQHAIGIRERGTLSYHFSRLFLQLLAYKKRKKSSGTTGTATQPAKQTSKSTASAQPKKKVKTK